MLQTETKTSSISFHSSASSSGIGHPTRFWDMPKEKPPSYPRKERIDKIAWEKQGDPEIKRPKELWH